jgi:hypothetical protein
MYLRVIDCDGGSWSGLAEGCAHGRLPCQLWPTFRRDAAVTCS